jgi:starch synthase
MVEAVARACRLYSDQKAWGRIVNEAMAQDFSWGASARAYDALYRRAIAQAAAAR